MIYPRTWWKDTQGVWTMWLNESMSHYVETMYDHTQGGWIVKFDFATATLIPSASNLEEAKLAAEALAALKGYR